MTTATDTQYELVLMLDPDVPDERRDQIADETRKRIESGGTLKNDASWGMRKMAYEIRQRTEADYRLFRFEGEGGVLDELNHNLRIADGVLRFRIFKVDPSSPAIVPPPAMGTSAGAPPRAPRREDAPADDAATAEGQPEAAAEEQPQAAAEEQPAAAAEQPEAAPEETAPEPAAAEPEPAEPAPEEAEAETPAEPASEQPQ